MDQTAQRAALPTIDRLPTGVPGLDEVLDGGLFVGDAYLVAGEPGTGKTTLGNQLAFAHAAAGGRVLFGTILTESHDRILAHLLGFSFVDASYIGDRIQYLSLLGPQQNVDLDGMLGIVADGIRRLRPTLLVIDGTGIAQALADSTFSFASFLHGLQARTALFGCTVVLLASAREADRVATHVDGVVRLFNVSTLARDTRSLRVLKLRGSPYLSGLHAFAIGVDGVAVFPRLEALYTDRQPTPIRIDDRVGVGVPALDAMLSGGAARASSTLLFGPPGSGKTILGLHFIAAGAEVGEPGLIAGFQELPASLTSTAEGVGIPLAPQLASGLVHVLWRSPLEFEPDEWAARLLAHVDRHGTRRVVVDALSDLFRVFVLPERRTTFLQALCIALRERGVTVVLLLEVDAMTEPGYAFPVPNVSAAVDLTVLVRTVEIRASLRRVVSVLKQRQSDFDHRIREFTIGSAGITVLDALDGAEASREG